MQIPFLSFAEVNSQIKAEIMAAFEKVFDGSWYILGPEVELFEKAYASFSQSNFCVGVSNGLDALFLALKALGIGAGDEVIVPAHTYIATLLAVSHAGATPVLADCDRETYTIDLKEIDSLITGRTKAILPVHLYGHPCKMDTIMDAAGHHNLFVIEDNAQAHGATFKGKRTGNWGHVNATSFYPGKNLGALGDAGAITTNDQNLYMKVKRLRNYGSEMKYYHQEEGYNMRLDECQAAFLSIKLKYLDDWTRQRQRIATLYYKFLSTIQELALPGVDNNATHSYHLYVVRTEQRDNLQRFLESKGIGTLIHYPVPVFLQPAYQHLGYKAGDFPIAEETARTCLSLPIWPGMNEHHIKEVSLAIKDFFTGQNKIFNQQHDSGVDQQ